MEDKDIVTLYWARSEEAIRATAAKYGGSMTVETENGLFRVNILLNL